MSSVIERLYPLPAYRRTPLSLFRWWESRRWFYNKVVGTTGLFTVSGLAALQPGITSLFVPELVTLVGVYAVMANVCYSFGWLAEVLATALWGREAPDMGPLLFRDGLILSVGVTLLPLLLGVGVFLSSTVARLLF